MRGPGGCTECREHMRTYVVRSLTWSTFNRCETRWSTATVASTVMDTISRGTQHQATSGSALDQKHMQAHEMTVLHSTFVLSLPSDDGRTVLEVARKKSRADWYRCASALRSTRTPPPPRERGEVQNSKLKRLLLLSLSAEVSFLLLCGSRFFGEKFRSAQRWVAGGGLMMLLLLPLPLPAHPFSHNLLQGEASGKAGTPCGEKKKDAVPRGECVQPNCVLQRLAPFWHNDHETRLCIAGQCVEHVPGWHMRRYIFNLPSVRLPCPSYIPFPPS